MHHTDFRYWEESSRSKAVHPKALRTTLFSVHLKYVSAAV